MSDINEESAVNRYLSTNTQSDLYSFQSVNANNVSLETGSYVSSIDQKTDAQFIAEYQTEKIIESRRYKLYKKESND